MQHKNERKTGIDMTLAYIVVLALVVSGMAVMLQVVSPGDAAKYLARGVIALLMGGIAICMLRTLILRVIMPSVLSGLAALRSITGWILLALLIFAALLALLHVIHKRLV